MRKKLNLSWVSDVIGEEYKKWHRGDIVLLQAQTGTGKTQFIKNILIDYIEEYERMLLVCNRTNLKRQLKIDLLKKYDEEIPYTRDEKGNITKAIDFEALDNITTIKNITITSYHAIQNSTVNRHYGEKQQDDLPYDFVVLDECHYILSDGSFNNKCRFAYEKLVMNYDRHSTKIFISATMEELKKPIMNNIDKYFGKKPRIWEYKTGIDYNYLNINVFKNIKDIVNTIKNDETDEKWLIFVTNKSDARNIVNELGEDITTCIFAGTKNDEVNSIINNNKFNKKVLICTKALDNGINLHDAQLTNIVVMAWDRVTFIQELGRKRIDIEDAQRINLYIPTRFKNSFSSKVFNCIIQEQEVDLFYKDENAFNKKYDNDLNKIGKLQHLFYRDKLTGRWSVNAIGNFRLIEDKKFFKSMEKKFDKEGELAFVFQQLEWLNLGDKILEINELEDVINNKEVESLEQFLETLLSKKVLKEQQEELSNLILKELTTIANGVDYRTKKVHIDTINSILKNDLDLPYNITATKTSQRINGKVKKYTYWTILKTLEI